MESKKVPKKRVGFISDSGLSPRCMFGLIYQIFSVLRFLAHLPILDPMNQATVGFITSGCPSPCLDKNISMGYVDAVDAKNGRELQVDFGAKTQKITVVKMPFVPTKYNTVPKKK